MPSRQIPWWGLKVNSSHRCDLKEGEFLIWGLHSSSICTHHFALFSTEQLLLMKHLNIWCWRSSLKTLQAQQLHLLKLSKFCQSLEILWMRTLKVFCFCRKGQKTVIVTGVGCRAARDCFIEISKIEMKESIKHFDILF